jgi:hypothetical protein
MDHRRPGIGTPQDHEHPLRRHDQRRPPSDARSPDRRRRSAQSWWLVPRPLPMSAARSRAQGWPKATRRAMALTPARTEPNSSTRGTTTSSAFLLISRGGPGGQKGTTLTPARPAHTPAPALRTSHSRTHHQPRTNACAKTIDDIEDDQREALDNKEASYCYAEGCCSWRPEGSPNQVMRDVRPQVRLGRRVGALIRCPDP